MGRSTSATARRPWPTPVVRRPMASRRPTSATRLRVSTTRSSNRRVWLSYEREGAKADHELNGRLELKYFLGSGKRGRTYLFEQQGYWFEAPINWYAKKQLWDMTPNYLTTKEMPLTLLVDPGCLHCHASSVAQALSDARNHYAAAPFAHGGITCTACHGDGAKHIASGGKAKMLDIDALQPVLRDSVCLNCHLDRKSVV